MKQLDAITGAHARHRLDRRSRRQLGVLLIRTAYNRRRHRRPLPRRGSRQSTEPLVRKPRRSIRALKQLAEALPLA